METWEIVGVVVAALAGIGGLATGLVGQHRAREANELAKTSNDVAARAVGEAERANRIAQEANELSKKAHEVVALQADQKVEQWLVEWRAQWDGETELVLTNHGRDVARRVYVVVEGDDVDKRDERYLDIAARETLTIEFPEFPDQRRTENTRRREEWERAADDGIIGTYYDFTIELAITVHWLTGLGQPRQQVLELTLE